jgi:hypothetical protein
MNAKQLEQELGRAEAIGQFVAEAAVVINQIDPEMDYNRAALDGFVRAAWPYEGTAADAAAEFAEAVRQQCNID